MIEVFHLEGGGVLLVRAGAYAFGPATQDVQGEPAERYALELELERRAASVRRAATELGGTPPQQSGEA